MLLEDVGSVEVEHLVDVKRIAGASVGIGDTSLSRLAWSLRPGDHVLVVGLPGTGKTSLLAALAGVVHRRESPGDASSAGAGLRRGVAGLVPEGVEPVAGADLADLVAEVTASDEAAHLLVDDADATAPSGLGEVIEALLVARRPRLPMAVAARPRSRRSTVTGPGDSPHPGPGSGSARQLVSSTYLGLTPMPGLTWPASRRVCWLLERVRVERELARAISSVTPRQRARRPAGDRACQPQRSAARSGRRGQHRRVRGRANALPKGGSRFRRRAARPDPPGDDPRGSRVDSVGQDRQDRSFWSSMIRMRTGRGPAGDFTGPMLAAPWRSPSCRSRVARVDSGRLAQNIMLAADAVGVASCPVTLHRDGEAASALGLPSDRR